jgi:hypothetical protein
MSHLGWSFLSDVAHTPVSYLKASLYALTLGDARHFSTLDKTNIMGAKPWWSEALGRWGASPLVGPRFAEFFGNRNMQLTLEQSILHTRRVALTVSDVEGAPWSRSQRQWLGLVKGVPGDVEPDPWTFDLRCYFGLSCEGWEDVPAVDWVY